MAHIDRPIPVLPPLPQGAGVVEPQNKQQPLKGIWRLTRIWLDWLIELVRVVNLTPQELDTIHLEDQGAAISATTVTNLTLRPGRYRVSTYAQITRPASTSSELIVTIAWTHEGAACSVAGAAIIGNAAGVNQTNTYLIRIDNETQITYATAYTSVGGTSMQYGLDVVLEALP